MDANHWPELMWLFIALAFGSLVICFGLLIWNAVFRRQKPKWILDTVLLGFSGLALVAIAMIFIECSSCRLSKGPQKLIGEAIMVLRDYCWSEYPAALSIEGPALAEGSVQHTDSSLFLTILIPRYPKKSKTISKNEPA